MTGFVWIENPPLDKALTPFLLIYTSILTQICILFYAKSIYKHSQ